VTLRALAGALALAVLFGASRPGVAATGAEALIARSDSIRALGAAKPVLDSAAAKRVSASDSAKVDTAKIARGDSLRTMPDTARLAKRDSLRGPSDSAKLQPGSGPLSDSLANKPRSLPPRTLTLRQQVMFAGGFMAFVALMMASMQNFNP
jgi:hypothetical protein